MESLFQAGVTLQHHHVVDGVGQGFRGADDNADLLRTGDARIDKVALEHHEVGHQQGHDHDGILRALRLMDGGGVGHADITVENVLIVVVAYLHHAVTPAIPEPTS